MPPGRIGRYRVLGVVGTGAFATVLRGRDDRLDAEVAIKVLAENHSLAPEIRERFVREGQLLRRVRSAHVVEVHDLGETDTGQPFLVLELARGGDLAARRATLPAGRRVSVDEVTTVATHVAAALTALHDRRVVHRDLAPGNLLLTGAGERADGGLLAGAEVVMMADLGLSKDLAAASGLTVGTGTAGFTPPEQGTGGWVDERADIWSASALVVWLVLGRAPDAEGAWLREARSQGWPDAFLQVLRRGLADEPGRRQESARRWAAELAGALRPAAPVPRPPELARTGGRVPRRRLVLAGAVVALLALAGGWWLGRSGAGAPATEVLADGRVRVADEDGDLRVALVGPAEATVGGSARFEAEVENATTWFWVAPDGRRYDDEQALIVAASSAGVADVTLIGVAGDGRRLDVEHRLRVDGP